MDQINNVRTSFSGKDYLTYKEVASLFNCSLKTVYKRKNDGSINFIQLGRKVVFPKADIDKLYNPSLKQKGVN